MTSAEDSIRARRKLTNRIIAAHEAGRLKPFLDPEVKLITGDGSLLTGAEAVLRALARQFADPVFVTYVRTTETVELDPVGERAAETGRWVGTWKPEAGPAEMSGRYLAVWRKALGQWVIESELYVTLG